MHHLHPVAFFPRNVIMIAQCASDNLDFEWTLRTENLTEISPSVQPSLYSFLLFQVVKEISFEAVLDWLQSITTIY